MKFTNIAFICFTAGAFALPSPSINQELGRAATDDLLRRGIFDHSGDRLGLEKRDRKYKCHKDLISPSHITQTIKFALDLHKKDKSYNKFPHTFLGDNDGDKVKILSSKCKKGKHGTKDKGNMMEYPLFKDALYTSEPAKFPKDNAPPGDYRVIFMADGTLCGVGTHSHEQGNLFVDCPLV